MCITRWSSRAPRIGLESGTCLAFADLSLRAFQLCRAVHTLGLSLHFRTAMKKLLVLSLITLLVAATGRAEPTRQDLVRRIETCEAILQTFQIRRDTAIPAEVWQRAKAVIILNQFKAGFLIGVQDGYGVIMNKKPNGRWSLPVLLNAGEASLGLQVGAKSMESILILTDANTPRILFKSRFNVGVDAKAVAGPRTAEIENNRTELIDAPILVYTKSTGLYAGATVKLGHLSRNDRANFSLYNTKYTLPELLYSDWVPPPAEVQPLMALMQKLAP
jgi:SH3 domain-containing YSC84-like protein 1